MLATAAFITLFAVTQAIYEPEQFTPADVIVVLGAGLTDSETLNSASELRVEKGIALYQAKAAPRILFTGGQRTNNGQSSGDLMVQLAMQLGVPRAAISIENRSRSTLQNALFSMPTLRGAKHIILVTEGFHLARSWLSFQWVALQTGQNLSIALARSSVFRSGQNWLNGPIMVLRETLALWFNLGRVGLWEGAKIFGVSRATRDSWMQ